MELLDAIMTRASAGRLAEPGPTAEDLARIVDAANRAPDHGRLKPWRLIVLQGASREKFTEAVVEARRNRAPAPNDEQLRVEREKISRSPLLLVIACVPQRGHPKVPEVEQLVAAGAAAENAFLAAHAQGYGVMWKTGPAAYEPGVKAALGLAPEDHIVAIMHFGTRSK